MNGPRHSRIDDSYGLDLDHETRARESRDIHRRRGAAVQNLAQSASFRADEEVAPSNAGAEQQFAAC
jgi:hypothetical protein